ncbi:lycopene cyclase domain-containing protein [Catellatospora methionotrophica]|uniref:lycopene cyclase domain-containing protein n=1 Tax=Catellatospora methionotrophica TaxID=121620 RepID=UPI0033CA7A8C
MDPLRYLLILAACVAVTLPLELILGARVYRQPRRLLLALAPVVAVFALWDLIAVARGHWWFSERYTTGVILAGLPLEEWLFFLVVPLCALLTFEVLGRGPQLLRRAREARSTRHRATDAEPAQPQLPAAGSSRGR